MRISFDLIRNYSVKYHEEKISERVSTRVVVVVVGTIFSHDVSNLCVYQRSKRGYENCLPHDSSFSSTAAFLPQ